MKNSWKLILGLVVVLLVAVGCVPNMNQRTISTQGQATVKADPDLAVVYASVETLADSADESRDENSKIMDRVYAELYKVGIAREDVETENFNIYEEFEWTGEGRNSLGFKTAHNLKIKTEQFDDVGEIVDAVIKGGATRINYINFELSDEREKELKKQALTLASGDAKEKAESMATGLGAKLGSLVSVSDAGYYYNPYPMFRAEAGAMDAMAVKEAVATQISPGELEVRADVSVVYQIR